MINYYDVEILFLSSLIAVFLISTIKFGVRCFVELLMLLKGSNNEIK